MNIAICLISTRKYFIYVAPLIESIKKYFLINHIIEIHLFTDDIDISVRGDERVKIIKELIPSYGFPEATLFRYRVMASKKYYCDYIYYLDVDYLIVDFIDEEIFGDIVAVLHPGFSKMGGGSWCTDKNSNAYTPPEYRKQYFCGGTQGGESGYYYAAIIKLMEAIDDDAKRLVKAIHNDESHWNCFIPILKKPTVKVLDSSYCYVEQPHLQKAWGIDHLQPKIVALAKNHELMRS